MRDSAPQDLLLQGVDPYSAVCCPGSCVLSSAHLETHQPSCGAPPLRSSFYLSGDTLRNHVTPHGGAVSFLFPVTSEQDAGNYACEAENSVSKETSKPETLSVEGVQKEKVV
ncbi:Fc receptor-like protein 6 [Balaenoptera musculus]|uniref:Fc receptor-like protein 6 n=1 Tax=Balaenoptera musculus TaxID=9771 RepID=A0A8B8YMU9_BALMU|nr:Fc receptor-like protein 6 [Balaenoptera musculus]